MASLKTLRVDKCTVGEGQPVFIIAEAGVNHNKSLRLAKKLVDIAHAAKADAVKFQTWSVEALYVADEVTGGTYRQDSRKRCLSYADFAAIKKYCDAKGIIFLSTPDEEASADFLDSLDIPAFKIGSGELVNIPLIEHIARKGKPIILSTGMGYEPDVKKAVAAVRRYNDKLILLHCISSYPATAQEATVPRVSYLRRHYKALAGYSDHTIGTTAAILSVAQGAVVIEKHFTFDKKARGPDHAMSLDPRELAEFVRSIREAEVMYSQRARTLSTAEARTKKFAHKSAVARRAIAVGERLSLHNVVFKRPGTGITVDRWPKLKGKVARRAIAEGRFIAKQDI